MTNIAEMEQILDGFQATGGGTIYPVPGFSQLPSLEVEGGTNKDFIDSDNPSPTDSTHPTKRRGVQENVSQSPLGRIRQKSETPSTHLVVTVEKMMATPT